MVDLACTTEILPQNQNIAQISLMYLCHIQIMLNSHSHVLEISSVPSLGELIGSEKVGPGSGGILSPPGGSGIPN